MIRQARTWLGMALVLGGAGLVLVHYIDYGWTAHWTFPDHGVFGAALVVFGVILGLGKPGTRAPKPGNVAGVPTRRDEPPSVSTGRRSRPCRDRPPGKEEK